MTTTKKVNEIEVQLINTHKNLVDLLCGMHQDDAEWKRTLGATEKLEETIRILQGEEDMSDKDCQVCEDTGLLGTCFCDCEVGTFLAKEAETCGVRRKQ